MITVLALPNNQVLNDSRTSIKSVGQIGSKSPNTRQKVSRTKETENPIVSKSEISASDFYKQKSRNLSEQITSLLSENQKLRKQCDHLRNLNFEYVKQLNEMSQNHIREKTKIQIPPEFFESDRVPLESKIVTKKLAANYKLLEKEQNRLINHCKLMEQDIENYRSKVIEAEIIQDKLKQAGETSIDSLISQLQNSMNKIENLVQENKSLSFQLSLGTEKIQNLEAHIDNSNCELNDQREEYQDLICKYNRNISAGEDKKNGDQKQIYALQIKCDQLEHELRMLHGTLQLSNEEFQHLDMQTIIRTDFLEQNFLFQKVNAKNFQEQMNSSFDRLNKDFIRHKERILMEQLLVLHLNEQQKNL